MSRIVSLLLVFALAGAAYAQPQPEPLVKKVKTSIAKGVTFLISQQRDDGSWEEPKDDKDASHYHGGPTALALLALLNCDGVLDEKLEKQRLQRVERGLANLRTIESKKVYVRALQTMALAEAGNPKDRAQIKRNVDWLLEARVYENKYFIGWEYENRKGLSRDSDASNSQYAMLALWYARQAGIPIDKSVWIEIRDYYTREQRKDGAWMYSRFYAPKEEEGKASGTMTVAGLCGLLIAGQELNADREQWQPNGQFKNCGDYRENAPAAKALSWISKNFKVDLPGRTFYHLYGLERVGRLSGQRFFGDHDWYREGCEYLTKTQNTADGSWNLKDGRWDRWPHVNTSFALLFLSKGRAPVLISKLVHGDWGIKGRDEKDLDWNNDRNDLRHLTEYLARTDMFGKKPLGWQTYDIRRAIEAKGDKITPDDESAIVADMLQAPILYISGHESPLGRLQGEEKKFIKRFVDNGGFIFAEACCGRKAFDDGIKELVKDIFDGNELTYIDSTHPVWTCENTIKPGDPYQLMKLEVGCRTVMLYSPQDLSCYWESNKHPPIAGAIGAGGAGDGRSHQAFRLGANIVAYATGKAPPLPRLTPVELVAGPKDMKEPRARGAFQVTQLRYSSEKPPAQKAMNRLLEHVHKTMGLDVKPRASEVLISSESSISAAKFLYMHGKNKFLVAEGDLPALRFTLENGGLLFADACCGDETFDKAFRKFAEQLFPKEKLVRVPVDDRLFSAKRNDGDLLSANTGIKCRVKKGDKPLPMDPYLEGIQIDGRWVVLYSKYDIGCALERSTSSDCVGYDHDSALRIATAAVRYNVRP